MESTMCNSALDLSTLIKSGRTKSNAGRDRVEWRRVCPHSIVVCEAGLDASSQALFCWWHKGKLTLHVLQRNLPLHVRTALVWVVTQRVAVISYRRFGQHFGPILKGHESPLTFEDGTDRFFRNFGKKLPLLSPHLQGSRIPLDPWSETSRLSWNVGKKLSLLILHLQGSRIPLGPWNETSRLSRNVGKKLSLIPYLQGSRRIPLKIGPIGCPETSVRNHHYSLPNNPEECISHLPRGGSLKSRIVLTSPRCSAVGNGLDRSSHFPKDLSLFWCSPVKK
jgi:hypothetical protein